MKNISHKNHYMSDVARPSSLQNNIYSEEISCYSVNMDYEQFKIKQFGLWDLYLNKNQFPYLGRCYVSAIRNDADLVTDMTIKESEELFSLVIPSWSKAIFELFGKFRPNIAILGNEWPHLHVHLIPRFKDIKHFYGIDFADPNPTGNYSPYPRREIPLDILLKIKEDIEQKIMPDDIVGRRTSDRWLKVS